MLNAFEAGLQGKRWEERGEGELGEGRGKRKERAWERRRAVTKLNKFTSCNHLWIKSENKG